MRVIIKELGKRKMSYNTLELYPEHLDTLKLVMEEIVNVESIDGILEIEVRVKLEYGDRWAVIGYGESGDPCLLRFD